MIFRLHILALLVAAASDPYAARREAMARELDKHLGVGDLIAQDLTD